MTSAYGLLKSIYRAVLPRKLRHRIYELTPRQLNSVRAQVLTRLQRSARHDDIYDAEYYEKSVEPEMSRSAAVIAKSLFLEFSPKRAIDVGCGSGGLLAELAAHGVACSGLDYSQAAIDLCTKRGIPARRFDLESDEQFSEFADVVISTEVAEHLPPAFADRYVDLLCRISPIVVLTAAAPDGTTGTDHVNEQPNEYWIAKFESRGFRYDEMRSMEWRKTWEVSGCSGIYFKTLMIFRRLT